jgi:hypothetical protein
MSLQKLTKGYRDRLFGRRGATNAGAYGAGHAANIYRPGDSGKATYRRFCPECGSALIDEAEILPNVTMIMAGTLDDASWVEPESEIFCDSAQPWVQLGRERRRSPKMPPTPAS